MALPCSLSVLLRTKAANSDIWTALVSGTILVSTLAGPEPDQQEVAFVPQLLRVQLCLTPLPHPSHRCPSPVCLCSTHCLPKKVETLALERQSSSLFRLSLLLTYRRRHSLKTRKLFCYSERRRKERISWFSPVPLDALLSTVFQLYEKSPP